MYLFRKSNEIRQRSITIKEFLKFKNFSRNEERNMRSPPMASKKPHGDVNKYTSGIIYIFLY